MTDKPDKVKVLFVDDEPHVLQGLALHLGRKMNLVTTTSGAEALEILAREGDFAVVVTDMRMPQMSGAQLLARARAISPDTTRMLLTGQSDLSSAISAVNEGGIFRFLMKPCSPFVVLEAVEAAAKQHRLVIGERELLEQTLRGSVQTLTEVLALTHPRAFGRAQRMRRVVGELCRALHVPHAWQVEVAAMLRDLGTITLPDEVVEKLAAQVELSDDERAMAARARVVTEQLLAHIPRLGGVRAIIAATSRPAIAPIDQAKDDVHRSAAILRVAKAYDELELDGQSAEAAMAALRARPEPLDDEVLAALAELRGARPHTPQTLTLPIAALQAGMVLLDELRMRTGALLVPRGFEVTIGFIERLRNFPKGSIPEEVRVMALGQEPGQEEARWHTTK